MPCYSPLHGYRGRTLTKNGKFPVVFNEKDGYRDLPVDVPCGQCIGCRLERSRQWAMRLMHEAQSHEKTCFITVTYSDEQIPSGQTLVKSHFQNFLKRLRKHYGGGIRYFHCGEYGETTKRPHYHACLYGVDFTEDRTSYTNTPQGHTLFTSKTLDKIWGKGQCWIGNLSFDSAAYVARYILKKVNGDDAAKHYENVNLETGDIVPTLPEYITMSLKPAIGANWYERYKSDVFPRDECIMQGAQVKPPKYYTRRLEKSDAKLYRKIKAERIKTAKKRSADNTPERLAVRLEVKTAQISSLKRNL